jgi:hypothetical protein
VSIEGAGNTEDTRDVEVIPTPTGTATPLTELALKQSAKEISYGVAVYNSRVCINKHT